MSLLCYVIRLNVVYGCNGMNKDLNLTEKHDILKVNITNFKTHAIKTVILNSV